mmetsp:Transcript_3751/g.8815  ORF Transcript_3751/g.8815 Transcript_3751/m.8815 type:complete len:273 (+) Transcript_3751:625-1443(+)
MGALRILLRGISVKIERCTADRYTQGGLDQEESVDLGDNRLQHQREGDQHDNSNRDGTCCIQLDVLKHDRHDREEHGPHEHENAQATGLLLLEELGPALRHRLLVLRGLLQAVLGGRKQDRGQRRESQKQRGLVPVVLHQGANGHRGQQAGGVHAEPHVGHEIRAVLRLALHLLGVLGLGQQIACGHLKLDQEEAHDEDLYTEVVPRHKAHESTSQDAHHRGRHNIGRLVEAVDGECIAEKTNHGLHGPGQLGDPAENLHLWALHAVAFVQE